MTAQNLMQRPQRWTEPFDPTMDTDQVQEILTIPPFSEMDESKFLKTVSLRGIIRNDCRILNLKKGDIIVREGDYGNSAFFIVTGEALVSLKTLPAEILGRVQSKRKSLFESFKQLWANDKHPEVRRYESGQKQVGQRDDGHGARMYLHDVPRIIPQESSESMFPGELFGELSALTRTPRSATVVANQDSQLLEIRWQGLRELMRDPNLKFHIEAQYRKFSLNAHLREVSLFEKLDFEKLEERCQEDDV